MDSRWIANGFLRISKEALTPGVASRPATPGVRAPIDSQGFLRIPMDSQCSCRWAKTPRNSMLGAAPQDSNGTRGWAKTPRNSMVGAPEGAFGAHKNGARARAPASTRLAKL